MDVAKKLVEVGPKQRGSDSKNKATVVDEDEAAGIEGFCATYPSEKVIAFMYSIIP